MNAYDLSQYGDKIVKIFAEFQVKLDEKVKGDRTFTDDHYESFVNADPTDKKMYLRWILDSFVNDGIKLYEDLLSRVKPALQDYDYLKQAGHLQPEQKIVENYCGIAGCTKKFKEKPGLSSLIDSYEEQLESRKVKLEETAEIKRNTEKVFESDELIILHPKTKEASCYYGRGTKWCTAATQGVNMFKEYNSSDPLYIIIPKKPSYEGEKYQMHGWSESLTDELDKEISEIKLANKYPSLTNFIHFKQYLFTVALRKGNVNDVKMFLSDQDIDPAMKNNWPISFAILDKNSELVKLLLNDDRVDPTVNNNYPLRWASRNGSTEVVKLLLEDDRIDPSDDNNMAIIWASEKGRYEIVKLLLADGRVDPTANNYQAVHLARQNKHNNIVKLLTDYISSKHL